MGAAQESPYYEAKSSTRLNKVDPYHPPGFSIHLRRTIVWEILPEVTFFTLVATVVCVVNSQYKSTALQLPTLLITVLGTVLGFIISYRTSSAQERYNEGRKLWSNVIQATRSFSRIAWIHVPNTFSLRPESEIPEEEVVRALIEKRTAINLCNAFAVAMKHYLRGEPGVAYKDLFPLVSFIPKYDLPTSNPVDNSDRPHLPDGGKFDPSQVDAGSVICSTMLSSVPMLPNDSLSRSTMRSRAGSSTKAGKETLAGIHQLAATQPLLPSVNPPPFRWTQYTLGHSLVSAAVSIVKSALSRSKEAREKQVVRKKRLTGVKVNENIPLELTLLLSAWVSALNKRKTIDPPIVNSLLASIASFAESLTGLERILLTPIPLSYQLHLEHTIYLYLLLLPLRIYAAFGFLAIPATTIITIVFLGFLSIGQKCEQPFGYDSDDIDMDSFCHLIAKEVNEICNHSQQETDPAAYFFVDNNLPFATYPQWTGKSAKEMVETQVPLSEIKSYLHQAAAGHRHRHPNKKIEIVIPRSDTI